MPSSSPFERKPSHLHLPNGHGLPLGTGVYRRPVFVREAGA
jgi:hypothetical protein